MKASPQRKLLNLGKSATSPLQVMQQRMVLIIATLSFLWRDCFDLRRKLYMRFQVNWPVLHLGTRWVCPKEVVALPVLRRSDWSGSKPATAVWADIAKEVVGTRGAECAFEGADARFKRVGRQRFIAMFAGRSEL